ncbi:hypothetical protein BZZ01_30235 [Nostocales cyanobacterium HT-58-2]|nr:hypothetical protein BZZ01_30235 [Nostocales cyanobacterium HT-58-2]
MYNQTLRAFTSTSPILINSQRGKPTFLTKSVTPKAKVLVLDTTENKNAQITKVFIPDPDIYSVPIISHQLSKSQQSGTNQVDKQTLTRNHIASR